MEPPLKRQKKSYSSRNIRRNAIFCPSCKVKLEQPLDSCPACGFTGQHTIALFGLCAPPLEAIVDTKGYWTVKQKLYILRLIARFQKKFPQLRLCFLFADIPAHYDIHLYAYWYCNVAPLGADEQPQDRFWTILFAYDSYRHRMAVMPCYKIEPFVSDDQWDTLLLSTQSSWKLRDTIGIKCFITLLRDCLIDASQRCKGSVKREPSKTDD
jgi:hypothetical protein